MRQCAKLSAHAFIVGYAVDFGSKAAEQRVVLHDFKRNCTITVSCAQQFGKRTQRFIIRFAGTAKYAQALTAVAQLKHTAVVLGSVLYKLCIQVAMSLGLPTNMMKLITAALFLLVLVLSGRKGEAIIHA